MASASAVARSVSGRANVQLGTAALARGLDDPDYPQAVERALRQQRAASEKGREVARAERLERQRRQGCEDVLRRPPHDTVENLDQPPLSRISGATPNRRRLRAADVFLTQQQHLDREIRVSQQRRERDQLVEHRRRRRPLRRPPGTDHLAVLVDPNNPALGRDRVHDPNAVLVKQRVELGAERTETPRLHLDQLAVGTDEVDHEPPHRHLQTVARLGQQSLHRGVKRPLAHHPDTRHGGTGYVLTALRLRPPARCP